MGDNYQEWWAWEVSEKFKLLTKLSHYLSVSVGVLFLILLCVLPVSCFYQCLAIASPFLMSSCLQLVESRSLKAKTLCSFLFTESLNQLALHYSKSPYEVHEPALLFAASLILICVQLPFFDSPLTTTLLILKFEYQWYFASFLAGSRVVPYDTVPYCACLVTVWFYQFYRHFSSRYSQELHQKCQRSEQKTAITMRLIPDGLFVLSQNEEIEVANEGILKLLNCEKVGLLAAIGALQYEESHSFSVLHDICQCFNEDLNKEHCLGVTPISDSCFEWRARKILWLNSEAVVIIVKNIDERKKLQKKEEEDTIKDALLSSVSHELRTPSYAISAYTEEVLEEESHALAPASMEKLRIVQMSAKMLLSLINDILDYSRIATGVFTINKSLVSPNELITECCDIMKFHALKKNLRFITRVDPLIPDAILTDPIRFKQILLNLLSNALKFTLIGEIEVSAVFTAENKLKIQVADTGIGIDAARLDLIFQAFNPRVHTLFNPEGCGLGLSISNVLATQLGLGPIIVSSVLGQGSSFTFLIDCELGNSFVPEDLEDYSEGVSESTSRIQMCSYEFKLQSNSAHTKLLLVDDNQYIRDVVGSQLKRGNVTYSEAVSGKEAVELVKRRNVTCHPIEVVLMDVEIPELNGWEATRIIRQLFLEKRISYLPYIIGHTADNSEESMKTCMECGMNTVLPKPCHPHILLNRIQRVIGV